MLKINLKNTVKIVFALVVAPLINNTNLMTTLKSWDMDFQDPATQAMEQIIDFHNNIMITMCLITAFVTYFLGAIIYHFVGKPKDASNLLHHGTLIEIIWTITPAVILFFIAMPSFALLYAITDLMEPKVTVTIVGHQWFWSYETTQIVPIDIAKGISKNYVQNVESYMVGEKELQTGRPALLETDNELFLPIGINIRLIITSGDVLHSWAVPSLGIKLDACPGRLNEVALHIKRCGSFYGQCSEICGRNHGFMPILVKAVRYEEWAEKMSLNNN